MVNASWHTERYESSLSVAFLRRPDERLPSRTNPSTCVERIFTSPNSAATNRPFSTTKNSARTTMRPSRARAPNPYPRLRLRSKPAPQRAPLLYSYSISCRCPESYADQYRITSGRRTGLHRSSVTSLPNRVGRSRFLEVLGGYVSWAAPVGASYTSLSEP